MRAKKQIVALLFSGACLAIGCKLPKDKVSDLPTHFDPPPAFVVTAVPAVTKTPPPASSKVVCSGPQKAPDGSGGFLWKNGDMTKKIVVLLPGKFAKVSRVVVERKKGTKETLQFTGYGNPDKDGDRQHFRGSQPVAKYKGKVEAFTGKDACVWVFKNASRVD